MVDDKDERMSDYNKNLWDLARTLKGLPPDEFNRRMNAAAQPAALVEIKTAAVAGDTVKINGFEYRRVHKQSEGKL